MSSEIGHAWTRPDKPCHSRSKDAVAAMIKRLAHRNANVQLYTLEVSFLDAVAASEKGILANKLAACKRTFAELRAADASRARVEVLYRCHAALGRRPGSRFANDSFDVPR